MLKEIINCSKYKKIQDKYLGQRVICGPDTTLLPEDETKYIPPNPATTTITRDHQGNARCGHCLTCGSYVNRDNNPDTHAFPARWPRWR